MAYTVVQSCPQTFLDWSSRASSACSRNTYHCVEDEESRIVEVCAVPLWIKAGHCPVFNTVGKDMNSRVCSGKLCPKEVYRSDAIYKYHGCRQIRLSTSMTTSTASLDNTPMSNTSDNSIIAGSVITVFAVILLGILGFILWRKKRLFDHKKTLENYMTISNLVVAFQDCLFGSVQTSTNDTSKTNTGEEKEPLIESETVNAAVEKSIPKELNADSGFISQCQQYLETRGNTLALYGKLGSGKRTLAAQIALRLAKNNKTLKIQIVRDKDAISEDLKIMKSTIVILHDPIKTWFTSKHTYEIIDCLSELCKNAKENICYVIAIFHCDDWGSLRWQFGKMTATIEEMLPKRNYICSEKGKLAEIANSNEINISNAIIRIGRASIGDPFIMTLFKKNLAFREDSHISNPIKYIFEKMKTLEKSSNINNQLAFRILVFFVLHDSIAKREFGGVARHALFADLKEKMYKEGSIGGCIKQLLELFLEETADGQSYRTLHDVITRCTFLAAVENHMTLLFTACHPILIFDCIRLKSRFEKMKNPGMIVYDYSSLKIALPTELYPKVVRLLCQRSDMRSFLLKSRFYDDERFQAECNKANFVSPNAD